MSHYHVVQAFSLYTDCHVSVLCSNRLDESINGHYLPPLASTKRQLCAVAFG